VILGIANSADEHTTMMPTGIRYARTRADRELLRNTWRTL